MFNEFYCGISAYPRHSSRTYCISSDFEREMTPDGKRSANRCPRSGSHHQSETMYVCAGTSLNVKRTFGTWSLPGPAPPPACATFSPENHQNGHIFDFQWGLHANTLPSTALNLFCCLCSNYYSQVFSASLLFLLRIQW